MRKVRMPYGELWITAKEILVKPTEAGVDRADELFHNPPRRFGGHTKMQTGFKRWMHALPPKHYADFFFRRPRTPGDPDAEPDAEPMIVIHGWTSSGSSTNYEYMMAHRQTAEDALGALSEEETLSFIRVFTMPQLVGREPPMRHSDPEKKRLMDFFFGKRRR